MSTTQPFERTRREVADKVRKLLAQAEDTAATAEEAQTFTMKAQQLMTKYSIGVAMIADAAKAGGLVEKGWTLDNPHASHKVGLVNAVARANDCRAIYADLPGGRKHIEVVGYAADVEWVETLSRSLEIQLAASLAGAAPSKPPGVHGRTFAAGFARGFVIEVNRRLQAARKEAVAEAEAARQDERRQAVRWALDRSVQTEPDAPSVALVLVAKGERVDDEFRVRHPDSRTVYSNVRLQSWAGYAPGRAAGRRASLARGSVGGVRRGISA